MTYALVISLVMSIMLGALYAQYDIDWRIPRGWKMLHAALLIAWASVFLMLLVIKVAR